MANLKNLDTVAYIVRNSAKNATMIRNAERAAKATRLMLVECEDLTSWELASESEYPVNHSPDSDEN